MWFMLPKFATGMNGALFIDISFAFLMFTAYVVHEMYEHGYRTRAKAAMSIMVLLLGEMILRGWFWWWRVASALDQDVSWMNQWPVVPIGMAVQMLGALCLIRVFSPDHWSRMTWLAVGVAGVAVSVAVAIG
jgi:hypothetical protein